MTSRPPLRSSASRSPRRDSRSMSVSWASGHGFRLTRSGALPLCTSDKRKVLSRVPVNIARSADSLSAHPDCYPFTDVRVSANVLSFSYLVAASKRSVRSCIRISDLGISQMSLRASSVHTVVQSSRPSPSFSPRSGPGFCSPNSSPRRRGTRLILTVRSLSGAPSCCAPWY